VNGANGCPFIYLGTNFNPEKAKKNISAATDARRAPQMGEAVERKEVIA